MAVLGYFLSMSLDSDQVSTSLACIEIINSSIKNNEDDFIIPLDTINGSRRKKIKLLLHSYYFNEKQIGILIDKRDHKYYVIVYDLDFEEITDEIKDLYINIRKYCRNLLRLEYPKDLIPLTDKFSIIDPKICRIFIMISQEFQRNNYKIIKDCLNSQWVLKKIS